MKSNSCCSCSRSQSAKCILGGGDDVIGLRLANHRSVLALSSTFRRSPMSASLPWQNCPSSDRTPTPIHFPSPFL